MESERIDYTGGRRTNSRSNKKNENSSKIIESIVADFPCEDCNGLDGAINNAIDDTSPTDGDDESKEEGNDGDDDDDDDENIKKMYPSDCYSFMSLYHPLSAPSKILRIYKIFSIYCNYLLILCRFFLLVSIPGIFIFGLMVFGFQMIFLIFMILSVIYRKLSNNDVDNPSSQWVASFINSNVSFERVL